MSTTLAEATVLQAFERISNQHGLEVVDVVYSDDYVVHDDHLPDLPVGAQMLKQRLRDYRIAFPDLHFTVTALCASEEGVTVHSIANATHASWYASIAPTGERVSAVGYMIDAVAGTVIHEVRVQWELVAAPTGVEHF